jgi:putative ABC transport system permease protein
MIRNYFKIAWRNILKNKAFSAINILGLALGMASSLLIFMWVQNEKSIDKYHKNNTRIFQVLSNQFYEGQPSTNFAGPGILAENIKKDIPEIEAASQILWEEETLFTVGNIYEKEHGRYVQNDFLNMFSFPLTMGDSSSALKNPNSIVISKKIAEKYFGKTSPLGKSIKINDKELMTVTGVLAEVPQTSSLKFDYLMNYESWIKDNEWAKEWSNGGPRCYVLLNKNADVAKVNAKIKNYVLQKDPDANREIFLANFGDLYLHGNYEAGVLTGGRIDYVNIFSIVAIFILIIACINFMNLATARSVTRAKEIGIRKVGGAPRWVLISQFMGESILIAFFAMLLSLLIVVLVLPSFNSLTEKTLSIDISNPVFWIQLISLTVLTGIASGSYPALFMASLNPVVVLKGALKFKPSATFFRKGLVVFQFGLSIMLILGMIVVFKQIDFIQSKNLGFDRQNLLYVPIEGDVRVKFFTLKQELENSPGIATVSASQATPLEVGSSTQGVNWPGKDTTQIMVFSQNPISYDYLKTMDITLLNGREFDASFGNDSLSFLVNEAAAKKIGYKDPVGKELTFWDQKGQIVGVMKDFHHENVRETIEPLILRLMPKAEHWGYAIIRTEPGKTKMAINSIEQIFKRYNPSYPVNYQFADLEFKKLYTTETTISSLASVFAILAIFISCLGLFGLATFTAEQRTKEIGIRKTLGASVESLIGMLSKDFIVLILISTIIAFPVAWFYLQNWLEKYAYRIEMEWWYFLLAAASAVIVALITVSYQAIKAAFVNPIKSLRSE